MKTCLSLLIAVLACLPILLPADLAPNRGRQLFVLIEERASATHIIAMTPARRDIIAQWNRWNPTYDFVSAVVESTQNGSKVGFTRYIMKDDYIPRVEHLDLFFPHGSQAHYSFFDVGVIVGFYRNSVEDFDLREIWLNLPPSQSLEPTAGRFDVHP